MSKVSNNWSVRIPDHWVMPLAGVSLPTIYVALIVFVFGSAVGSFANVVIYRVPQGMSIIKPRSRCTTCGHTLSWWENIPIASYIALRGSCRNCKSKIRIQYPIIEALIGVVWVVLALNIGLKAQLPAYLVFATVLIILSATDLEHRRIPNKILFPSMALGVVLLAVASAVTRDPHRLAQAGIGALAYGVPMFALGLALPAAMGFGDIKLAFYLGLHLGWIGLRLVGVGAFLGFFAGAAIGIGLIASGRKSRKDFIPFGPSMAAGALAAILAGRALLHVWLGV
ncbi:MAG: A24 family peptidase [Actinomycetota bacterium]